MSTKKKVGLAGIMGMQSRPVNSTQTSTTAAQDKKKQVVVKSKTATNTPKKAVVKALPKSKDKDFKLTGVYLRKTTVGQVKAQLELSDQDMSELVEDLLTSWLKKN